MYTRIAVDSHNYTGSEESDADSDDGSEGQKGLLTKSKVSCLMYVALHRKCVQ